MSADVEATLAVWDERLVAAGEALGSARADLVGRMGPVVAQAYADLAGAQLARPVPDEPGAGARVGLRYDAPWMDGGLAAALARARGEELRRGVSLVGPHRDDLVLSLHGMPARTQASQGEQRCVALSLRLGVHRLLARTIGEEPILLLDDVLSELDPARGQALLRHIREPHGSAAAGQTVITTTSTSSLGVQPDLLVRVAGGRVLAA
jgi:DNA replication and repair protein RecF